VRRRPIFAREEAAMRAVALLGRILFGVIFIFSSLGHFSHATIEHAARAGVPMAHVLVPLSGAMALVGGLMVLFGFYTRIGALILLAFLIPVTLTMHAFWSVNDPALRQMQLVNFMKNVGLVGGATLLVYFGAGPLSVDSYLETATSSTSKTRSALGGMRPEPRAP
jgi:putative oxidoreductase